MPIDIAIINESGCKLELLLDKNDILNKIIPDYKNENFYCLRYVDPYGDTYFNSLQIPQLIRELDSILLKSNDPEIKNFLRAIIKLSQKATKDVHLYIKFIGD